MGTSQGIHRKSPDENQDYGPDPGWYSIRYLAIPHRGRDHQPDGPGQKLEEVSMA